MTLIPLAGRIMCYLLSEPRRTASGIYIADKIKEFPRRGRVLAVGGSWARKDGTRWEPFCEVDDVVHFRRAREQNMGGGIVGIWFEDVIAIEPAGTKEIKAPENYLIIDVSYRETLQGSTIIIPDAFKKQNADYWGVVLDIGPKFKHKQVKAGDKIIFPRDEGFPIQVNGKNLVSLRERWVVGILD